MNWTAKDTTNAAYIGTIEILDSEGEPTPFELVDTGTHIVFGSTTNIGLLESGNFEKDNDFSLDENLTELIEDLKSFYGDGDGYQSDAFSCNDRL